MNHADKPLMIKDAAKILDIGSLTLFRLLKANRVIGKTNNLPRQDLVSEGIFKTEIREAVIGKYGIKRPYAVTLVTPKGLSYLRELIEKEAPQGETENAAIENSSTS